MSRVIAGPEMTQEQRATARRAGRFSIFEQEHYVMRLLKWLPAGATEDGVIRERDLIAITARHGGMRVLAAKDIVVVSDKKIVT